MEVDTPTSVPDSPLMKGEDYQIAGDFPLAEAIIAQLPAGVKVLACDRYGFSKWTITARITATMADGVPKCFFLKCAKDDEGKKMLEGEFHSMSALYKTMPNLVPEPLTWGKIPGSSPETYFFLCDFIDMKAGHPDPMTLCTKIVKMHKSSVSPMGMFGFHIPTCQGNLPQDTTWNASWEACFTQMMRHSMNLNTTRNGRWMNLEKRIERIMTHVIPMVVGPLEAEGRKVKPSLIHGDLWDGNIATSVETGDIYCFDASVCYAHHELEVAIWKSSINEVMNQPTYLDTYLNMMGKSEPAHMFDDRHMLYSVYMTLHASACHGGYIGRAECYMNAKTLIDKYAPWSMEELDAMTPEERKMEMDDCCECDCNCGMSHGKGHMKGCAMLRRMSVMVCSCEMTPGMGHMKGCSMANMGCGCNMGQGQHIKTCAVSMSNMACNCPEKGHMTSCGMADMSCHCNMSLSKGHMMSCGMANMTCECNMMPGKGHMKGCSMSMSGMSCGCHMGHGLHMADCEMSMSNMACNCPGKGHMKACEMASMTCKCSMASGEHMKNCSMANMTCECSMMPGNGHMGNCSMSMSNMACGCNMGPGKHMMGCSMSSMACVCAPGKGHMKGCAMSKMSMANMTCACNMGPGQHMKDCGMANMTCGCHMTPGMHHMSGCGMANMACNCHMSPGKGHMKGCAMSTMACDCEHMHGCSVSMPMANMTCNCNMGMGSGKSHMKDCSMATMSCDCKHMNDCAMSMSTMSCGCHMTPGKHHMNDCGMANMSSCNCSINPSKSHEKAHMKDCSMMNMSCSCHMSSQKGMSHMQECGMANMSCACHMRPGNHHMNDCGMAKMGMSMSNMTCGCNKTMSPGQHMKDCSMYKMNMTPIKTHKSHCPISKSMAMAMKEKAHLKDCADTCCAHKKMEKEVMGVMMEPKSVQLEHMMEEGMDMDMGMGTHMSESVVMKGAENTSLEELEKEMMDC